MLCRKKLHGTNKEFYLGFFGGLLLTIIISIILMVMMSTRMEEPLNACASILRDNGGTKDLLSEKALAAFNTAQCDYYYEKLINLIYFVAFAPILYFLAGLLTRVSFRKKGQNIDLR